MYHRKLALGIFIAFLTISVSADQFISATSDKIYTIGRSFVNDQNEIGFNWPCFQILLSVRSSSSEGGELILSLEDTWNRYEVFVNNQSTTIFQGQQGILNYSIFRTTDPGDFQIQIFKITENHYGPFGSRAASLFSGVWLRNLELLPAGNLKKTRKLEVFSDSDSNGFGIDSNGTSLYCTLHMKQVQNCQQGWASQIGNLLSSEMHIEAWSGKGVVRNAFGVPGCPMPEDWTRVTTNAPKGSWDFPDTWIPDAVLVWLGGNDLLNPIRPEKKEFTTAYYKLLQEIYNSYEQYQWIGRQPKIVAIGMQLGTENSWILETVLKFNQQQYKQTYFIEIPSSVLTLPQDFGCIGHINLQGQTKIAQYLAPILEGIIYH